MSKKLVSGREASLFSYALLSLAGLIIAFPFFWVLSNSLKTKDEIWAMPPRLLPAVPQWLNYSDALVNGMFFRYMWNSMYASGIVTVIILINSALFAYAITQIRFKGRNFLFLLVMVTYIMPSASTYIPGYVILSKLRLINTHSGWILSSAASIFNIFYFRQTFLQINHSILEAARIDGAGHRTLFWRIVVPMSAPSFATLGILSFIGNYNTYMWPALIIKTKAKYFISMGLRLFFVAEGAYGLKWGTIMAACCVTIFPLLLIFALCERRILNSITGDQAIKE
ncbi:MAG: carbohydrate ABC transporter permease [Treponema sp.]|jgi:multiple sugar transport system permease protein|nr:carbohydrate ABC transporter permease [Treponema sp.]